MMALCWWCGGKRPFAKEGDEWPTITTQDGHAVNVHQACKPDAEESVRRITAAPPTEKGATE